VSLAHTPRLADNAIVFQCPKSGSISPVLIVRKIKEKGIAVGGIPANFDNDTSIDAACCPPGERAGEVVNQMQKVALEVFNRSLIPQSATSPGRSGSFLSVSDQQVHTSCPASKRTFFNEPTPEEVSSASPSSTSPYLPQAAPAPVPGPTPLVAPNLQYAQGNGSPLPDESNNGGRVPTTKRRPSTGSITKRPSSRAGKNISSDSLPLNSGGQTAAAEKTTPSSAVLSEKWWIDAGEAAGTLPSLFLWVISSART
jgi:recombining binding protein suppressor of hairless